MIEVLVVLVPRPMHHRYRLFDHILDDCGDAYNMGQPNRSVNVCLPCIFIFDRYRLCVFQQSVTTQEGALNTLRSVDFKILVTERIHKTWRLSTLCSR